MRPVKVTVPVFDVFKGEVPSEKQYMFFESKKKYVGYGGARGGGKSWALRKKVILLCGGYAGIRILLIRRTLQDLRENHTIPLKNELNGITTYNDDEKAFYFPNGSRLKLGYFDNELSDAQQYQGQEYDIICMDEGTQFSEYQFNILKACLRGGKPLHPKRFYITCNPGGIGHAWVKRLFIDHIFRNNEKSEDYEFIPAKVYDNVWLMKYNPDYVDQLLSIPDENLRKAWLNGEWDTFSGQYFTEFDKNVHVCRPFAIPTNWYRYYANDYGLDALAGLWIAMSPNGVAYVYREIFKGKDVKEADASTGLNVSEAAQRIKALETDGIEIFSRLAPPDLFARRSTDGLSPVEMFANNGIYFTKASNERINGWMALKEWLRVVNGKSNLQIFDNCINLIRCIPLMQYNAKDGNDASTEPHEISHLPDALRYWAVSRPCATYVEASKPFDAFRDEEPEEDFYDGQVTDEYMFGGY